MTPFEICEGCSIGKLCLIMNNEPWYICSLKQGYTVNQINEKDLKKCVCQKCIIRSSCIKVCKKKNDQFLKQNQLLKHIERNKEERCK